jgi:autotransporter-associated beta strand protein
LTLSGAESFSGGAIVTAGTLTLDGTTGSFMSGSSLGLYGNGATFVYEGAPAGSTQSLSSVAFSEGDSTVQVAYGGAGTTSITASHLFRLATANVNSATGVFLTSGGTNGVTNKIVLASVAPNSLVDPGIAFGTGSGNNFAWNDAAGFLRAIDYAHDSGAVLSPGGASVSGNYVQTNGPISSETTNVLKTLNINGANDFTLASGATLTVTGLLKTGGNGAVISGGSALQAPSGGTIIARTDQPTDTLSISTPIVDNGGSALTVTGPGTVILSGTNTFAGATSLNGGVLSLQSSGALGHSGRIYFTGGTLQYSTSNTVDYSGRFETGAYLSTVSIDTNGQDITFASGLIGAGVTLRKLGDGTLTIPANGNNGGNIIEAGTLTIGPGGQAGFGPLVVNAGSFDLNGVSSTAVKLLSGAGGAIVNSNASTQANLSIYDDAPGVNTFSGTISGNISLSKYGFGTLVLGGSNTYTGTTEIQRGMLQLSDANALQGSGLKLDFSGQLAFSPSIGVFNIGQLTDFNDIRMSDASGAPVTLQVGGNNTNGFCSGILSGSGSLVKNGTGSLILSNVNTYDGGTVVNNGTLTLTSTGMLGSGALAVNGNGGALSVLNFSQSQLVSSLSGAVSGGGSARVNVPAGTTLTVSQSVDSTFAGTLALALGATAATSGALVKSNGGTLQIDGGLTLGINSSLSVNGGKLRLNIASPAGVGSGVTASITGSSILELAGTTSALGTTTPANRVAITNNSNAAAGLLVSAGNQQVGGIGGSGTTQVNAGASLTADHIIQGALIIGGASDTPAMVTIDASSASGNPLGQSDGLAFAGLVSPSGPFGAGGIDSADLSNISADSTDPAVPATRDSAGIGNASQVPEPSALLLALLAVLVVISTQFARHYLRSQTV